MPELFWNKVVGVKDTHDGDSCRLIVDIGFEVTATVSVRLEGIDAPELGTPGATEARDRLEGLLKRAVRKDELYVRTTRKEKYGRWLGLLYADTRNINQTLLDEGLVKAYDGGKR